MSKQICDSSIGWYGDEQNYPVMDGTAERLQYLIHNPRLSGLIPDCHKRFEGFDESLKERFE